MISSLLNLTKTLPLCLTFFATSLIHSYGFAETKAHWIWPDKAEKSESAYFRKEIVLPAGEIKSAKLQATCDNGFKLFINEKQALSGNNWGSNYTAEVKKFLQPGKKNAIAVEGINQGGVGGFVMQLILDQGPKKKTVIATDTTWVAHRKFYGQWKKAGFGEKGWTKVISNGKMGDGPWGDVFGGKAKGGDAVSSLKPASDEIKLAKGFESELIYTVPKKERGSWVSICVDDKGRLITSDQGGQGLYRIDVSQEEAKVERLQINITSAQGLLHAFGSLWVNVNGKGAGVYRFTDTNGDGAYDKKELIKSLSGGGEHGPHALVLGPDGKHIYVVGGNMTKLPEMESSRVPTNWGEDHLLKRLPDARGHAKNIRAPGGWIARFGKDGKNWETIAMGFRNTYDMAFNIDGELFAYDSDMEWDAGTPWYRPTRFYHVTSGADFGWRTGTGKWPQWYPDCLPPAYGIGPGSPVGVTSGLGSKFPSKYQKAIYCLDWTYGTMSAMHLKPKGSSYLAEREEFVASAKLRMTDAVINPMDGAMYFTVGGRGGQSALYRVTYTGKEDTAPALEGSAFSDERSLRTTIESHHVAGKGTIDKVWKHLGHEDRHIRWAARVALEHQPVEQWQDRTLKERSPQASLTALCALARHGESTIQGKLLTALEKLNLGSLTKSQQLELLRVYQLTFIRMGKPDQKVAEKLAKNLDIHYPSPHSELNRELVTLLVFLKSPNVVGKTLALMSQSSDQKKYNWSKELLSRNGGYARAFVATADSSPQRDQIHFAKELRNMDVHWKKKQWLEYFRWYKKAEGFKGGNSFSGFLKNFRNEALVHLPEELKEEVEMIQKETSNQGPPFEVEASLEVGILGQQMRFNKDSLSVNAGKNVELIFHNDDTLPLMHNLLLVKPGSRMEVVNEAIAMGADGMANNYVPDNANILASTPLIQIGNSYKLYFKAPAKPGNYEFVCTYPGHGLTMWGTLLVE
tara:strand:+ start:5633 stop:8545 length:2913 start_codon:yes stop_codon:yes gene_type:complete